MEQPQKQTDQQQEGEIEQDYPFLGEMFFDYLKSDQGKELAGRIVTLFEEIKKATLDKNARIAEKNVDNIHSFNTRFQIIQAIVYIVVILASGTLAYLDKFSPAVGLLFGTIIGYFFGRRQASD